MDTVLPVIAVGLNLILVGVVVVAIRRLSQPSDLLGQLSNQLGNLDLSITQQLRSATADMAGPLWSTKGVLRQEVTDRVTKSFREIRNRVQGQLTRGRREQTQPLLGARTALPSSLP